MNAIETRSLSKYYGAVRGIESIDLAVEQGDFFGFIGPNGAGKSTTIRTLLGLIRPSAGTARLLGLDIRTDREELLSRVGYLPAETAFYPGMRVRDVLKLSADLRRRDCRRAAEELCRRLQLDPARRAEELSLGNRKKAAIVCALQHEPELLILDEPTAGLDPLMQREFFAILRERNQAGTTVFLSSHILSEVQRHCAHAAMIRRGAIIAGGTVESLVRAGARRVSFRGHACLDGLDGVQDLRRWTDGAAFLYSGETQPLLAALASGQVRDLTVAEPDLEDVFLHCYGEGGGEP